jgi:hypothetical protein
MSRRTITAVVTVLLLSVAVGNEQASAGEWSADYRAFFHVACLLITLRQL